MFGKTLGRLSRGTPPDYHVCLSQLISNPGWSQSYDTLVSSLQLLSGSQGSRSVLVTSAQPGEGKTMVAINLGLSLALARKKAILIDADLRRSNLHRAFRLRNTAGFADFLRGERAIGELRQGVSFAVDGDSTRLTLDVVPSGRVRTSAFSFADSPAIEKALQDLLSTYDVVLFDSPPVLAVSDALLLASQVQHVILVVGTGIVTERDAKRAKQRLEGAGGHLMGVVMNRFDSAKHGPGYHPYDSYYHDDSTR